AEKRRRYTLNTLGVMACLILVATLMAFWQGVVIRQLINSAVLVVVGLCFVALYRSKKALLWPTYTTVLLMHLIVTSGFISNGGLLYYGMAIIPPVPLISALLLG